LRFARAVARSCSPVSQMLLPCVGHWLNGPHHRCLAGTIADIVPELLRDAAGAPERPRNAGLALGPCLVTPDPGAVGAVRASHA
jgi:hypothetical protein